MMLDLEIFHLGTFSDGWNPFIGVSRLCSNSAWIVKLAKTTAPRIFANRSQRVCLPSVSKCGSDHDQASAGEAVIVV